MNKERQEKIRNLLRLKGDVTTKELLELFPESDENICNGKNYSCGQEAGRF